MEDPTEDKGWSIVVHLSGTVDTDLTSDISIVIANWGINDSVGFVDGKEIYVSHADEKISDVVPLE